MECDPRYCTFGNGDGERLRAEVEQLRAEVKMWSSAEAELSKAYLRLRAIIPGAFDTPHAPSREQVWQVTEDALKKVLGSGTAAAPVAWIYEIASEKRGDEYRGFREQVTEHRPCVQEGAIRNLRPLHAGPEVK